jgi:hypothetical protein
MVVVPFSAKAPAQKKKGGSFSKVKGVGAKPKGEVSQRDHAAVVNTARLINFSAHDRLDPGYQEVEKLRSTKSI